jgi:membrane-associated phospholipid phosphatase
MQSTEETLAVATLSGRVHRTYWWKEVALALAFYVIYSMIRNRFGSAQIAADGVPEQAFNNAMKVVNWELALGLFHEQTVQTWFVPYTWFIQFWNTFYGTAHFVVTITVFVLLYRRRPDVFPIWRNTLGITTALAIIGFAFFPVMPPRLLDQPCPPEAYGGACIESDVRPEGGFGFRDTLKEDGGPWSFDSDTMKSISNQYAAMPSLHIAWSSWCAFALWPIARRWWIRALLLLYPAATLFCIVVTGNHFWLDGVGGLVILTLGFIGGWSLHAWNQRRLERRLRAAEAAALTGG